MRQTFTDEAACAAILAEATVGALALTGADGSPYVLPVSFVYCDGCIYIHCALQGLKLQLLAADPRVCFTAWVVDELRLGPKPCDSTMHYRSVVARGLVRELTDQARKRELLLALAQRYEPALAAPPSDQRVAHTRVLAITISEMTGKRTWREA